MELFVCVKSTPASETIIFDEVTGNLQRAGSEAMLNPIDHVTIEAGLRCVEDYGGRLSAVSMGPHSAEAGLRTALSLGVSSAYLLCDPAFAGADVLATAHTLAGFFRSLPGYDIIFCGKHSADGDTGQTGAMLAEILGIPHACGVCTTVSIKDNHAIVRQRFEMELLTTSLSLPCLVIMENDAFYPRNATLAGLLHARRQKIKLENLKTISHIDPLCCGVRGSSTRVKKMSVQKHSRRGQFLSLDNLGPLQAVLTKSETVYE